MYFSVKTNLQSHIVDSYCFERDRTSLDTLKKVFLLSVYTEGHKANTL